MQVLCRLLQYPEVVHGFIENSTQVMHRAGAGPGPLLRFGLCKVRLRFCKLPGTGILIGSTLNFADRWIGLQLGRNIVIRWVR